MVKRTRSEPDVSPPDQPGNALGIPGQVVLVFQGGGALGAYQAGVFQALHDAKVEPDWVIGTSIGAINGAIIAGNPPHDRLERLKRFWDGVARHGASNAGWAPGLDNWLRDVAPGGLAALRGGLANMLSAVDNALQAGGGLILSPPISTQTYDHGISALSRPHQGKIRVLRTVRGLRSHMSAAGLHISLRAPSSVQKASSPFKRTHRSNFLCPNRTCLSSADFPLP